MKKNILTLAAILTAAVSTNAQETLSGSKFFDNWQVGVKAGGYSPTHHEAFIKSTRATFGAEIGKQISPVFRLGVEGMAYVRPIDLDDNLDAGNFIDGTNVSLVGTVNLSNLFGGYKEAPRFFEVEGFAGLGWMHRYVQDIAPNYRENYRSNSMTAQFGSNLLFNLGQSKAWGVKLSPAIIYAVDTPTEKSSVNSLNSLTSVTQLTAGVVYRFKGSNGAHHFTRPSNREELEALNKQLAGLREDLRGKDGQLSESQKRIAQLEKELEQLRNKKPEVIEKTVIKSKKTLESVVTYRVGRTNIEPSQLPNVERIATYLKKYPNSKVVIKGYASPEGNLEKNQKLAADRAESVKKVLVTRYKISSDRIQAEGNGIGDMFSEPDWNRVSISTIVE